MGGQSSDFGFSYQRAVFALAAMQHLLQPGDSVGYERSDDVDFETGDVFTGSRTYSAIQCKTGCVPKPVFAKVIKNWLLNDTASEYFLYLEQDISSVWSESEISDYIIDDIVDYIQKGKTNGSSLNYRLYEKYSKDGGVGSSDHSLDEISIRRDIGELYSKYTIRVRSFEELREDAFCLFQQGPGGSGIDARIAKLRFERVLFDLDEFIKQRESKKERVSLDYSKYYSFVGFAISHHSIECPSPQNYTVFRKQYFERIKSDPALRNSREARLLGKVFASPEQVLNRLVYEYYYKDFCEVAKLSSATIVADAEQTAYDTYLDRKLSVPLPEMYHSVVNKGEVVLKDYLPNCQLREGVFVYLSGDECNRAYYMDWGQSDE